MINRLSFIKLSFFLLILLSMVSNVTAIKVDPVQDLAPTLNEGIPVNFTLKIEDLDQRSGDDLTIETDLIRSGNSPIFDFGELNEDVGTDIYTQTLHLNLSTFPNKKTVTIKVSGISPKGEISDPIRNDLVLTSFKSGDLKYYEVKNGKNFQDMAVFKLNIQKVQTFENTMQQIKIDELKPLQEDVRRLFNYGFATEAQNMAYDMSEIKLPSDNLMLFNFFDIKSNFTLNFIVIVFLLLGCIIGFVYAKKTISPPE